MEKTCQPRLWISGRTSEAQLTFLPVASGQICGSWDRTRCSTSGCCTFPRELWAPHF